MKKQSVQIENCKHNPSNFKYCCYRMTLGKRVYYITTKCPHLKHNEKENTYSCNRPEEKNENR